MRFDALRTQHGMRSLTMGEAGAGLPARRQELRPAERALRPIAVPDQLRQRTLVYP